MVMFPVCGTSTTRTRHVPYAVPRTELPTNLQCEVPAVMLMRMVPCDRRGIASPAAAAMRAAVADLDLRMLMLRDATKVVEAASTVVVDMTVVVPATVVVVNVDVVPLGATVPAGASVVVVIEVLEVEGVVVDVEVLVDDEVDVVVLLVVVVVVVVDTEMEFTVAAAERSV